MSAGGKGSKRRRSQVSYDQFSTNWDTIFGKKHQQIEIMKACCQESKCCGCDCDPSNCCCQKYE